MQKTQPKRIIARKLARELTEKEIDRVAGAGETSYLHQGPPASIIGDASYN